jgi:hypothetical protein
MGMRLIFVAIGTALVAQTAAAMPEQGCYEREYSVAEMSGNPGQVVRAIYLAVDRGPDMGFAARLYVNAAAQGHAVRDGFGGRALEQWFTCLDVAGVPVCDADCAGDGGFSVTRDMGGVLDLATGFLQVGDPRVCGWGMDLAEVAGVPVSYRLIRVQDSVCEGL